MSTLCLLTVSVALGAFLKLLHDPSALTGLVYITFGLFLFVSYLIGPVFIFTSGLLFVNPVIRSQGSGYRLSLKIAVAALLGFFVYPIFANMLTISKARSLANLEAPPSNINELAEISLLVETGGNIKFVYDLKAVLALMKLKNIKSVFVINTGNIKFVFNNTNETIIESNKGKTTSISGVRRMCKEKKYIDAGFKDNGLTCSKTLPIEKGKLIQSAFSAENTRVKKLSVANRKLCRFENDKAYKRKNRNNKIQYHLTDGLCIRHERIYELPNTLILQFERTGAKERSARKESSLRAAKVNDYHRWKIKTPQGQTVGEIGYAEYEVARIPFQFKIYHSGANYVGSLGVSRRTHSVGIQNVEDALLTLMKTE